MQRGQPQAAMFAESDDRRERAAVVGAVRTQRVVERLPRKAVERRVRSVRHAGHCADVIEARRMSRDQPTVDESTSVLVPLPPMTRIENAAGRPDR